MDPYAILGVPTTASKEEIIHAYRTKALRCHPDHFPEHLRTDKNLEFLRLKAAYDQAHSQAAETSREETSTTTKNPDEYEQPTTTTTTTTDYTSHYDGGQGYNQRSGPPSDPRIVALEQERQQFCRSVMDEAFNVPRHAPRIRHTLSGQRTQPYWAGTTEQRPTDEKHPGGSAGYGGGS